MLKNKHSLSDQKLPSYYKWLLLGESKTGKTTALRTMPGPRLAIGLTPRTRAALSGTPDTDLVEHFEEQSDTKRVRGTSDYSIVPQAWDGLWNTIVDLWELAHSSEPFPYRSIMLDDLSTANTIAMNHVLSLKKKDGSEVPKGLAGAPAQAHYMPQMALMERLINGLFLTLPCHILVCGHMTFKDNEDTGISAYYPAVFGSLRERVPSWFDEVYEADIDQVRTSGSAARSRYIWRTIGYGQKQFLGSTLNRGLWESPVEVDLTQSPSGIERLLSLKGGPSVK